VLVGGCELKGRYSRSGEDFEGFWMREAGGSGDERVVLASRNKGGNGKGRDVPTYQVWVW
jgi:hypothetical protein